MVSSWDAESGTSNSQQSPRGTPEIPGDQTPGISGDLASARRLMIRSKLSCVGRCRRLTMPTLTWMPPGSVSGSALPVNTRAAVLAMGLKSGGWREQLGLKVGNRESDIAPKEIPVDQLAANIINPA